LRGGKFGGARMTADLTASAAHFLEVWSVRELSEADGV
jgi:hypothetical protein